MCNVSCVTITYTFRFISDESERLYMYNRLVAQ
jgi:hypothetical protein